MKSKSGKSRPYRLRRLKGERPKGHPETDVSRRKKVFPIPKQVWVERATDQLWVVKYVVDAGKNWRDCQVYLVPYGRRSIRRSLSVRSLDREMRVWEAAVALKAKCLVELRAEYSLGHWGCTEYPTFQHFAKRFGFDPKSGCRVD